MRPEWTEDGTKTAAGKKAMTMTMNNARGSMSSIKNQQGFIIGDVLIFFFIFWEKGDERGTNRFAKPTDLPSSRKPRAYNKRGRR